MRFLRSVTGYTRLDKIRSEDVRQGLEIPGIQDVRLKSNWSGRNEVTQTSSRLHPLWPQNKWLHTPRTTDFKLTRQDRWIQTELAFTLTKNATKTNTLKNIPLQTTRKENNWKTEVALARAAVTVGTERIKGSNHLCLMMMMTMNTFFFSKIVPFKR